MLVYIDFILPPSPQKKTSSTKKTADLFSHAFSRKPIFRSRVPLAEVKLNLRVGVDQAFAGRRRNLWCSRRFEKNNAICDVEFVSKRCIFFEKGWEAVWKTVEEVLEVLKNDWWVYLYEKAPLCYVLYIYLHIMICVFPLVVLRGPP